MQGSDWINLLRRIPANLHNELALGLVTGGEVVVQQLIRMENDFVIVRGRMSGSTAEGRVMIVPYSHMTLLALNKPMPETEVQAIFGAAPSEAPVVEASAGATTPSQPAARDKPADGILPKPAAPGQPKPTPPSKSVLLARLRERLAEKSK